VTNIYDNYFIPWVGNIGSIKHIRNHSIYIPMMKDRQIQKKCENIHANKMYKPHNNNNNEKNIDDNIPDQAHDQAQDQAQVQVHEQDRSQDNNIDTIIRYDKNKKVLLRKKQLFDHLNDKKLAYVKNGICDAYIRYGTPSLETVIHDIQTNSDKHIERLKKLIKRLKKEGEKYDEKNIYYQNYIKNGGDIEYNVNEGIKEWFYINKTNYPELLANYKDEDRAQAKAYNTYIKKYGPDKYTERIRKSEMILRLY
jgi:hypothetical protein